MQRAVKRGLERRGEAPASRLLGVDETSFQKGHEYMTAVADIEGEPRVHQVADGRGKDALSLYYESLSEAERSETETVAMDMWPAYISATVSCLRDGGDKIAYDKFHVAAHLGDAVEAVRREEHRQLRSLGDEDLTDTRYLWLYHPDRVPEHRRPRFREKIDAHVEDGPLLALEGGGDDDVGAPKSRRGAGYVQRLVLVGDPQPPGADEAGGRDDQGPSRGCAERHRTWRHERTSRRHQLGDPVAREIRTRLSQSEPLPHRHLLPSRWTRPLPRFTHIPPETLKSQ